MQAAVATLTPHLATAVANVAGETPHMDQALRYSHLTKEAVQQLEAKASALALEMLTELNGIAHKLQQEEEGSHLFVTGAFVHVKDQTK